MASKYLYKIAADGSQEYNTMNAARLQSNADWGTGTIDADVIFEYYNGIYDETIDLTAGTGFSMRAQCKFSVIFRSAAGHTPVIQCLSGGSFTWSNAYWNQHIFRNLRFENPGKTYKCITQGAQGVFCYIDSCQFIYTGPAGTANLGIAILPWVQQTVLRNCYIEGLMVGGNGSMYWIMEDCEWYIPSTASSGYSCMVSPYGLVYFDARNCIFRTDAPMSTGYGLFICSSARHRLKFDGCVFDGISRIWYNWNSIGVVGRSGNFEFTNNICINFTDTVFRFSDWNYDDLADMVAERAMIIEGNCFYNCVGITRDFDTGVDTTLTRLRALGFDIQQRCKICDPLFVDAPARNYHLQPVSPAIRGGVGGSGKAYDYFGVQRGVTHPLSMGIDGQYDTIQSNRLKDYRIYGRVKLGLTGQRVNLAQSSGPVGEIVYNTVASSIVHDLRPSLISPLGMYGLWLRQEM